MKRSSLRCSIFIGLAVVWLSGSFVKAAPPAGQVLDCRGVKIHYVVEGTGEPVLLIHALYSSTNVNWQLTGVIGDLAKDHRVIAFDLPGHGRSDKPDQEEAYGQAIIHDIVALLDHLKVRRAHVVGYSIGGMIAVKLMAQHPERVKSGLVGGMGWFRAGTPLQKFWERAPGRDRGRVPPAFFKGVTEFAVTEDELKKIAAPVEVLVGDRDPVKQLYVAPLRQSRPDWSVVEIPRAGHVTCIMKPEYRDEIARWVRRQSKP